jgi:hypothetical protein
MASRTVPTSVKVFGIMNTVFGTLGLLSGLNGLASMGAAAEMYQAAQIPDSFMPMAQVQTVVSLLISLGVLATGVGLLTRQPWARSAAVNCAMAIIGIGILSLIATVVVLGGGMSSPIVIAVVVGSVVGLLLSSIYYGLLIYFLNKPEVKEALS